MTEQNDKDRPRKAPYIEESPSWQFPKITGPKITAQVAKDKEAPKRRVPDALFNGRLRTSTLVLVILYVLLDVTKKPIPAPEPPAQPWAPPTNAVFGPDGNWTIPAQVPTTQQYYPPQPYVAPKSTPTKSKPSTSETPSTSESTSGSPKPSESTDPSESTGSPHSSETSDGSEPRPSRPRRESDSSSPSPSPTAGSAESHPTSSATPNSAAQPKP